MIALVYCASFNFQVLVFQIITLNIFLLYVLHLKINVAMCKLQTTRIYAPWKVEASPQNGEFWHEIARPQVHGHDINCFAVVHSKGNHRFVGGAEEKVARVFEAPLSFLKTLNNATLQKSGSSDDALVDVQILGANMSALGLSQKPIYVQGQLFH